MYSSSRDVCGSKYLARGSSSLTASKVESGSVELSSIASSLAGLGYMVSKCCERVVI